MIKQILVLAVSVTLTSMALPFTAFAKPGKGAASGSVAQGTRIVSGIVESMESMENESLVKIKGSESMYSIKNLLKFPEAKLRALTNSKETGATIRVKITPNNEIVDVLL